MHSDKLLRKLGSARSMDCGSERAGGGGGMEAGSKGKDDYGTELEVSPELLKEDRM